MSNFLQQGLTSTSKASPNKAIIQKPSVQIHESMGNIHTQTTILNKNHFVLTINNNTLYLRHKARHWKRKMKDQNVLNSEMKE